MVSCDRASRVPGAGKSRRPTRTSRRGNTDMADAHPILLATIAGFACALIFASIPVGPINLTILNEGAQRGFRWALLIGLGASVMDTIYCAISFTGLSSFFDHGLVKATMQVFSFVFLLFLGFKFLLAETVKVSSKLDHA